MEHKPCQSERTEGALEYSGVGDRGEAAGVEAAGARPALEDGWGLGAPLLLAPPVLGLGWYGRGLAVVDGEPVRGSESRVSGGEGAREGGTHEKAGRQRTV